MAFCAEPRALLAPHFWSLLSDDNPDEDEDEDQDDDPDVDDDHGDEDYDGHEDDDDQDHVDNVSLSSLMLVSVSKPGHCCLMPVLPVGMTVSKSMTIMPRALLMLMQISIVYQFICQCLQHPV